MSKRFSSVFLLWLALAVSVRAQAPYVIGHEAWRVDASGAVHKDDLGKSLSVEIPAVASRPAFKVALRPPATVAPDELPAPAGAEIFVMADTHGEFEIVTELLTKQGVIGPDLNWAFGRGRLVITGDVFDRGPHHTELLWLYYKLEAEAAAAGGAVHLLLGNHESMVLTGDLRYLNDKYPEEAKALGVANYAALWDKTTLLGQWLRTKPAMFKLGRTLFMHGGASGELADAKWSLHDANETIRAWLNGDLPKDDPKVAFLRGPLGPLWYRGYFPDIPKVVQAKPEAVAAVRAFYDVDRIAVGHTIVETVTPMYDDTVIAVQVYPERDKATGAMRMEGVFIDVKGTWHRAKIDGTREPLGRDSAKPSQATGQNAR